ncbi:DUF1592 domain-containing protein [bacterium AH-315-P07]|nr:DUF1592 domain-containing protein [bacterium AH-315-P07]
MKYWCCIAIGVTILAGCQGSPNSVELRPALHREAHELALQQEDFEGDIYPFFEEFCFSCHDADGNKGGINLEDATLVSSIGRDESKWERVLTMLESGQMPPAKKRQPSDDDRREIAGFIEEELDAAIRAMRPDPGRVTARRLNRQEYDNTIRDLLGTDSRPSAAFPVDDSGYGFDNNGDVLSLSPSLLEKYLSAAEELVAEAVARELAPSETSDKTTRFIFICGHDTGDHLPGCANVILWRFAARAYRRPVAENEVRDLHRLVTMVRRGGGSFEEGIELAIDAVLVSPKFLYRIEQDDNPRDPGVLRYVNDFELASRLSYFLWSTMPDDELFDLARAGTLRNPDILMKQVARMLADEKSEKLVTNFAGQWLELRNLSLAHRDRNLFPEFNGELRRAMERESYLFFAAILNENRSILSFLDSDFTFVNERLAKHYGIEGIEGKEHQRIRLNNDQRGGILTQASVLTLTSFPTRTSPVVRGAWILENILGTPPPPPPEDVPQLKVDSKKEAGTIREQFERHRADASCASCHKRIDPLGFGLENYNAIGKWRTEERGIPVDSSGVLPGGISFSGSAQLRDILFDDPDNFIRCFTEKMLTYALGRGVESFDRPVIAAIEEQIAMDDYRLQSLIREIVLSVPFQMRRGEGETKA